MTTVELGIVRDAFLLLVTRLEAALGDRTDVDGDYFWSLSPLEVMKPDEPGEPGLGSLVDCLESLRRVVDDPESAITYDLVRLGDVLRVLGLSLHPAALWPAE